MFRIQSATSGAAPTGANHSVKEEEQLAHLLARTAAALNAAQEAARETTDRSKANNAALGDVVTTLDQTGEALRDLSMQTAAAAQSVQGARQAVKEAKQAVWGAGVSLATLGLTCGLRQPRPAPDEKPRTGWQLAYESPDPDNPLVRPPTTPPDEGPITFTPGRGWMAVRSEGGCETLPERFGGDKGKTLYNLPLPPSPRQVPRPPPLATAQAAADIGFGVVPPVFELFELRVPAPPPPAIPPEIFNCPPGTTIG